MNWDKEITYRMARCVFLSLLRKEAIDQAVFDQLSMYLLEELDPPLRCLEDAGWEA